MPHPLLSVTTNPKLALVEPLFAFLERHPDAWSAVSQLARSRAFFLAERVEDRVRMAVEAIEAARGSCDDLKAIKAAVSQSAS